MATSKKTRRRKPAAPEVTPAVPTTPEVRPGFRDADYVQSVVLRMGTGYVDALDELCSINRRSRREIVEALVAEATAKLTENNAHRITMPT